MRDAAGERAECLELLRMVELSLQVSPLALALGDLRDVRTDDHAHAVGQGAFFHLQCLTIV